MATIVRVAVPDGYAERLLLLAERILNNVPERQTANSFQREADAIALEMRRLAGR